MIGLDSGIANGKNGKLQRWLPVVLWMALIFTLSSVPLNGKMLVRLFRHQDKLIHFIEYGILGVLLVRAVFDNTRRGVVRYWACIAAAVAVGAVDELHQSLVPTRMMDWQDLMADAAGALVFVWLWLARKGSGLIGWCRVRAENEAE